MKCYKLTDENMETRNNTKWVLDEWKETKYPDAKVHLCSGAWLHGYLDPLLAVLLNPIHANFDKPRLFEAEAEGEIKYDGQLKFGCQRMRLIKELALPKIPLIKQVELAIKLALKITKNKTFIKWAKNWLNGTDRLAKGTYKIVDSVSDNITYYAAKAAWGLAQKKKETNKRAKSWATECICEVIETKPKIDLVKTIKQILNIKKD